MVKINEKDYKKIENFCKDYGVEKFQSEKDTFCLSHVSLRDDQILDYWNEYRETENERMIKGIFICEIGDLLRYEVKLDEEGRKKIKKIVEDCWNLACSWQKIRDMMERIKEGK